MDMLIVFGENVENNNADGFENIEAEVFDVVVEGLCPTPEESQGRKICCH